MIAGKEQTKTKYEYTFVFFAPLREILRFRQYRTMNILLKIICGKLYETKYRI